MRSLLVGIVLGALLSAGAVEAKVIPSQFEAGWLIADNKLSVSGEEVLAGAADPSLGLDADAGSIYLRRAPDAQNVAHGQLWLKTGVYPIDWLCVAGC